MFTQTHKKFPVRNKIPRHVVLYNQFHRHIKQISRSTTGKGRISEVLRRESEEAKSGSECDVCELSKGGLALEMKFPFTSPCFFYPVWAWKFPDLEGGTKQKGVLLFRANSWWNRDWDDRLNMKGKQRSGKRCRCCRAKLKQAFSQFIHPNCSA